MTDLPMPDHRPPFFAVFRGKFPAQYMAGLARRLVADHGTRVDREWIEGGWRCAPSLDFGGAYHHTVVANEHLAGTELRQLILTETVRLSELLNEITGDEVVDGPYVHSAVTLKHYGPGDTQGWHYDTNPVTLLLFLSDCPEGGELIVAPYGKPASDEGRHGGEPIEDVLQGEQWAVRASAGDVLVMSGRRFVHRVREQPEGADRIMTAVNLYYANDTWRPSSVDEVVYGGAEVEVS